MRSGGAFYLLWFQRVVTIPDSYDAIVTRLPKLMLYLIKNLLPVSKSLS